MKKIIAFLALASLVVSCKNLADNEFEVTGEVNSSLEGKKVILQKPGGWMGIIPIDTVLVKDGKFVFRDTLKKIQPELCFVTIDGVQGNLEFVLEPGAIELTVDKDTLSKSATGGTYNNDKLEEFKQLRIKETKVIEKFVKANDKKYNEARAKGDKATTDKLEKELQKITKDVQDKVLAFMKENPKAYYNLYILRQMRSLSMEESKKVYDGFDASVKNTELGKQMAEFFAGLEKQKNNPTTTPEEPKAPETKVKVGQVAPQFSAKTPEGKTLALKDAMGKATIIDFWASWCGPCRAENPNMVALYNEFHGKGLNIIGVSLDKPGKAADWKAAIDKDKLTWNHVSNLNHWDDPIVKEYGVDSIPAAFLLDKDGKVVAVNLRGEALKAKVAELLK